MFNWLQAIDFNSDFITGIAFTITVGTAIVSLWKYLLSKGKGVSFDVFREDILSPCSIEGVSIIATSKAGTSDRVVRNIYIVSNRNDSAIADADFAGLPISISRENGVVHSMHKHDISFNGTYNVRSNGDSIAIDNLVIPAGHAIALEIVHDGCVDVPSRMIT
ncbi:hypothetical protein EYC08_14010 [Tabrizicola sp. WMC-M-20]|nr:hypothetical protein EYC08_14010 [Tabrizicola sp. WMC-M-20]